MNSLPTSNFGIRVENNAKEILQWFVEHGYDRNDYFGKGISEGTYYITTDNSR